MRQHDHISHKHGRFNTSSTMTPLRKGDVRRKRRRTRRRKSMMKRRQKRMKRKRMMKRRRKWLSV